MAANVSGLPPAFLLDGSRSHQDRRKSKIRNGAAMNGKRARRKSETRLAALVYLSSTLDDLSLPIQLAEDWVRPADLLEFLEEVEKQVRALKGFIDSCLEHSKASGQRVDPEIAYVLRIQLAGAQKSLYLIDRIGKAGTETDGKSNSVIVREEIRRAIVGRGSATDFSAEAEELRQLRSGELKIKTPSASQEPR